MPIYTGSQKSRPPILSWLCQVLADF